MASCPSDETQQEVLALAHSKLYGYLWRLYAARMALTRLGKRDSEEWGHVAGAICVLERVLTYWEEL